MNIHVLWSAFPTWQQTLNCFHGKCHKYVELFVSHETAFGWIHQLFCPVTSLISSDSNLSGKSHCRILSPAFAKFQALPLLLTVSSCLTNLLPKMLSMTLDICSAAVAPPEEENEGQSFLLIFIFSAALKHRGKKGACYLSLERKNSIRFLPLIHQ